MKFSLKQLTVFDAVANHQSVTVAAQKLSMTQSAVSMSLAQFENVLDRPLFIREGKRLTLSHWGRWLRPKAKKLLHDAQQIETGLHGQQIISGNFALGASQTFAKHVLPQLISKIDLDFPELRIDLVVDNTEVVIKGLINHDFDMGIIEGHIADSRIHQEHIIEDHLVIFTNPHHAYAKNDHVSLGQLEQAKWILREQGAGTREIFDGAVHGLIDKIDLWKEYKSVSVIKALVKNGSYLGCLPYLDLEREVEAGSLIILSTPDLNMKRSLSFVWRKNAGDNPLRECILTESRRLIMAYKNKIGNTM